MFQLSPESADSSELCQVAAAGISKKCLETTGELHQEMSRYFIFHISICFFLVDISGYIEYHEKDKY